MFVSSCDVVVDRYVNLQYLKHQLISLVLIEERCAVSQRGSEGVVTFPA